MGTTLSQVQELDFIPLSSFLIPPAPSGMVGNAVASVVVGSFLLSFFLSVGGLSYKPKQFLKA